MKEKKRGGANRGQGRKKSESPKVNITFRLRPDLVAYLKTLPNRTQTIETLLENSMQLSGYEKPITDEDGKLVCVCTIPSQYLHIDHYRCSKCGGHWFR